MMRRYGHMPLLPYIEREDTADDRDRYQTLYGSRDGAVAALTAGLHFDQTLLAQLDAAGVAKAEVTLHVGAGTFQPVRAELKTTPCTASTSKSIKLAAMPWRRAGPEGQSDRGWHHCRQIVRERRSIVAQPLKPFSGDTDIFRTRRRFPCSGRDDHQFSSARIDINHVGVCFRGYRYHPPCLSHSDQNRYRFFSYGDAMFLTKELRA